MRGTAALIQPLSHCFGGTPQLTAPGQPLTQMGNNRHSPKCPRSRCSPGHEGRGQIGIYQPSLSPACLVNGRLNPQLPLRCSQAPQM